VTGELQSGFGAEVGAAAVTLAACVGFSVWGRGIVRLLSTLLGLVLGVIIAVLTGVIGGPTVETIASAAWVALPDPSFVSYGFEPALIPAFMASAIAAALRTVGVITTAQ